MMMRIESPYYVAGLEVDDSGKVIKAAPILKWTLNKSWPELHRYFLKKNFRVTGYE